MKVHLLKSIFVFGFSLLFGVICFLIADPVEYRNYFALGVTTVSCTLALGAAFGCDYNCGKRNVNIRTAALLFSVVIILSNLIFSFYAFNVLLYVVIQMLFTLSAIAVVYALYKPQQ
jgi:hypothetical protein